jgi:hypothetical protein
MLQQPGDGPLDLPSVPAQPPGGLHPAAGDPGADPPLPQRPPAASEVVGLVGVQPRRAPPWPPDPSAHRPKPGPPAPPAAVSRGCWPPTPARPAVPSAVHDQVVFAARLAAIGGIGADQLPHAWPARWCCPGWPPTSPAHRQHGSGPAAAGAAAPTRRTAATPSAAANRSPRYRSLALWLGHTARAPRSAAHRRCRPPRCGRAPADGHPWVEAAELAAAARSPPTIHREQAPQRSWAEILTQTRRRSETGSL